MITVCFVCHGNICRSPMAEYIFKKMLVDNHLEKDVFCFSRSTSLEEIGNDIYPPAKRELMIHHVPFGIHRAQRISLGEMDSDYIFLMDNNNLYNLRRLYPNHRFDNVAKILSLIGTNQDVQDPWYTGDFETVYRELNSALTVLVNKIKQRLV